MRGKSLAAIGIAAMLGMEFGRRDRTKGVVMDSYGNVIDILDDHTKLMGREPSMVIIDEVTPMMSGNLHDILTRPLPKREAIVSPKAMTKRKLRRLRGKVK